MKNRSETNKEAANIPKTPRVSIVDDDESVREAIKSLLRSIGFGADAFASAEEFLNSDYQHNTECLIVDVRMPGMSGLQLQEQLASAECDLQSSSSLHMFLIPRQERVRWRLAQSIS